MRDVREQSEEKLIKWAYECAPHFRNNFGEGIGKHLFKDVIKNSALLASTTKNTAMLRKLFENIGVEKYKGTFALHFQFLSELQSILSEPSFRKGKMGHFIFHHVCRCISSLEEDKAMIETAYVC